MTDPIATSRYDDATLQRLIDLLAGADADGDEARAREMLGRIGQRPRLLLRLDAGIRRLTWRYADPTGSALEALLGRAERDDAGLIALTVASMHRYGQMRERVVRKLIERAVPEVAAFLVLRADDWVAQVRTPTRTALSHLLSSPSFLEAAVPMALKLADRDRGRYAFDLVNNGVRAAPEDLRRRWTATAGRDLRRLVFDADQRQDRLDLAALIGIATREGDTLIRHRAASAAHERALAAQDAPALRRLATARSADVRALGLTGLLRLGPAPEAVAALDDPAPLVRAIAREAARRTGLDVVAHYRSAEPTPGSVAGLTETGSDRDTPLLVELLDHPAAPIRTAAVRGLGRLGAVPVEVVLPLLRDPAPAVVREAAALLSAFERRIPPELPWNLLADARPEVRRAGYRLLSGRDLATRFQAALQLAGDADPHNAARGEQDALRLAKRPDAALRGYETPGPAIEKMRLALRKRRATPGPLAERLALLLG